MTPEEVKAYKHAWYMANRERVAEQSRRYRAENKDRIAVKAKEWVKRNSDKVASYKAKWAKNNPGSSTRWGQNNIEKMKASREKWRANNREKFLDVQKAWASRNPDKHAAAAKRWRDRNPAKVLARARLRDCRKKQAAPAWLTKEHRERMAVTYEAANLLSERSIAELHEVDHIVPLQGRRVCGLHVPWNLQILTAEENSAKRNYLPPADQLVDYSAKGYAGVRAKLKRRAQ